MKGFLLILGVIFIGLGLLAYFVWPFNGEIRTDTEPEETRSVVGSETFSCPNGPTIATTFYSDDTMEMTVGQGTVWQLESAMSASGARYINESEGLEFWEHQGEATVTADGRTYEGCVAGEARDRYITEEIVNGYALSFVPPPGATVSLENETFYKLLFAGANNEPPALTDGYTVTMTLLDKPEDASLEDFVEEERDQIRTAGDATLSPTEINGHEGYSFTYDTELGPEATDTYLQMEADTVARITVSAVGANAQGYRAEINNVLESIAVVELNQ